MREYYGSELHRKTRPIWGGRSGASRGSDGGGGGGSCDERQCGHVLGEMGWDFIVVHARILSMA